MATKHEDLQGGMPPERLNAIISSLGQDKDKYQTFVESGTNYGDTPVRLYEEFDTLHTIELDQKYYERFDKIIEEKNYEKIVNHFGDTIDIMPLILEQSISSEDKSIFWLDGHWSGGDTALGIESCPLFNECTSIDNLYKPESGIIIIDDYRLFEGGWVGWDKISVENILSCFKEHKVTYKTSTEYDCMSILITK